MEETKEMQKLHGFMQCTIYMMVALEAAIFVFRNAPFWGIFDTVLIKLSHVIIYKEILYSKFAILTIICLVSIGTLAKKKVDLDPKNHILYPLSFGFLLFFGSIWICNRPSSEFFCGISYYNFAYLVTSLFGTLLISLSLDNVSKLIRSGLGKDIWNDENESFLQPTKTVENACSINIPMQFYYKGKVRDGYVVIENFYRSLLVLGVSGSGKTMGLIIPTMCQLIHKSHCLCIYDYKFPDLGKIAYFQYLLAKQSGRCEGFNFHVVNLNEVERSRRTNPWRSEHIQTLAEAMETAEGLVEAMKKGDKSGGSDQFFTQSAINFLASCIYFFSKHQQGKFSSVPHVLSFLNCSYEDIFSTLFSEPELGSLLSPFRSAFYAKAFDQLEGQIGTLKIFISRLATKETFWVFSGDDFNLKISDRKEPSILILANDPNTQNINSACYSIILNRLTKLINSRDNLPSGLIIDEAPTIFINRIENILSVGRSQRIGICLGVQELTHFKQQYGKDTADTIVSVIGNVLSGAVRNKDTLEWLERLFGKSKQMGESLSIDRNKTSTSLNEKLEVLIPAGKIASLKTAEIVGLTVGEIRETYTGKFESSALHCKINLDLERLKAEQQQYRDLPVYFDFGGKKEEILMQNFNRINAEVAQIVGAFKSAKPNSNSIQKASMGTKSLSE